MALTIIQTEVYDRLPQSGLYFVNEKNELCVVRYDRDGRIVRPKFSGSWVLLGFAEKKPFGQVASELQPVEKLTGQTARYKNGKGKFMMVDNDHGMTRLNGWAVTAVYPSPFREEFFA